MSQRLAFGAQVSLGEARRFDADGAPVCVVNLGEDGFRAVGDVCSHAEAYLHEGEVDVEEGTIECPLHGSVFDLTTGAAKTLPATRPVPVYEVTVDGDDLLIEANE
jgi:3-phenylpropionate/trans-cinnamate dioxygenase ferredoxin component